jgi:hypothetical protein
MSIKEGDVLLVLTVENGPDIGYDMSRRFLLSFAEKIGRGRVRMDVTSGARAWPESYPRWRETRALNQLSGVPLTVCQSLAVR